MTNTGDRPVLFVDGDELIGAKQNRVVNLTILVPALTTLKIPVSCVEAGRWQATSHTFTPARHMEFAAARASRMDQVSASLVRWDACIVSLNLWPSGVFGPGMARSTRPSLCRGMANRGVVVKRNSRPAMGLLMKYSDATGRGHGAHGGSRW